MSGIEKVERICTPFMISTPIPISLCVEDQCTSISQCEYYPKIGCIDKDIEMLPVLLEDSMRVFAQNKLDN